MKLARAVIGGLVLAAAPLAAMAEGMSYSYVEADYVDIYVDDAPSDDGYLLSLGLRGEMSQFEAEGNVIHTDLSDGGDDTAFEVAGRWSFTDMFSAGIAYRMSDDANLLFAGVRLSW